MMMMKLPILPCAEKLQLVNFPPHLPDRMLVLTYVPHSRISGHTGQPANVYKPSHSAHETAGNDATRST